MMPDLPNVDWERDVESFREFFENPDFRTDGLKIYPTLVIRGTGLYELWKKGLYKNYPPDKVIPAPGHLYALILYLNLISVLVESIQPHILTWFVARSANSLFVLSIS